MSPGMGVSAQGSQVILAATKSLHDTVKELRDRIRALETALNGIHLERTGHTHPLLAAATIDQDQDVEDPILSDHVDELPNPMQKAALFRGRDGSLRLTTALSKIWIMHSVTEAHVTPSTQGVNQGSQSHVYPQLHLRHLFFPLHIPASQDTILALQRQIPPNEIVAALTDVFHQTISVPGIETAFSNQYIQENIIPNARSHFGGLQTSAALASLFAILAIGSLFTTDSAEAPEVGLCAELSTEALALSQVMAAPSIEAAEALYLRAFLEFLRQGHLEEQARVFLAMAAQTCLALGLHRDGALFGLQRDVVERRRIVFWMIYHIDLWENLVIGRPARCGFGAEFIDTEIRVSTSRENLHADYAHKLNSMTQLTATIARMTTLLKPPKYMEMLDIDEKVRKLSDGWRSTVPVAVPVPLILLIFLHRAFYARALIHDTEDLSNSRYSYSVNATLYSARELLKWSNVMINQSPAMCSRYFWIWNTAITATAIYKLMLDHSPHCEFAGEAREGFAVALQLFHLGCQHGSGRARQALAIFSKKRSGDQHAARTSKVSDGLDGSENFIVTAAVDSHAKSEPRRNLAISATLSGSFENLFIRQPHHLEKILPAVPKEGIREIMPGNFNRGISLAPSFKSDSDPFIEPQLGAFKDDASSLAAVGPTYTLWNGYEWINMDQRAKQFSSHELVPPISAIDGSNNEWTGTSGSDSQSNLWGSLNGEWISAYYR